MKSICTLTATAFVIALSGTALADPINPWDFNVFSRGDISYTGSDFQGAAGAVGNGNFSSFSLRVIAGSSPSLAQSWYGGGSYTTSGGDTFNGGIETAGSVSTSSHTVHGSVRSGGTLTGNGGTITGNAVVNSISANTITIPGGTSVGAFGATVDLGAVSSFFVAQSIAAAALANTTTATDYYGTRTVNAVAGINVVTLTAAELQAAHTFVVNGPASATLIVNVLDGSATLDSTTWAYNGGVSSRSTIVNFRNASTLHLTSGNIVNVLAPFAATTFDSGLLTGNAYVGSFSGGGQVNWVGSFNGTIPAPGAAGVVALGGLAAMRRRRR